MIKNLYPWIDISLKILDINLLKHVNKLAQRKRQKQVKMSLSTIILEARQKIMVDHSFSFVI